MRLILITIIISSFFNLNAQVVFSPEENTKEVNLDLNDVWIHTQVQSYLLNNTSDTLSLRWEIFVIDAPQEWEFQFNVSDDGGGSFYWGLNSNIDDLSGVNIPLPIMPNDSSKMNLGVRPRGIAGCGTYEVRVTSVSDTSNILAVGTYHAKINTTPDCTTSISEIEKNQVKIFPNPATDYFTLTATDFVKEIQIFNSVGKRMKTVAFQNGQAINVSSFPNGLYLVRMLDKNGEVLKTTRLITR